MTFLADAIEAIEENWEELSGLLDAAGRAELLDIVEGAESDPEIAADELRDLIKPLLAPGHPVRDALTPSGVRYQPVAKAPGENPQLMETFRKLRTRMAAAGILRTGDIALPYEARAAYEVEAAYEAGAGEPTAEPAYRPDADDAWILAAPSLPAASVELPPDQVGQLIVLTDENEVDRVPAFQLPEGSGAPYPVVIEINKILSADEDPWGAADWWLGVNVWLGAAPASLLGTGVDHALLSAARAEIPEW
ncbi:hypothetical protein OKJ48_30630 [Streptomyces kunmingensis]|uniref:Uncharacterized protein n=1 Tax=Streptomyces kunmingensis TaxID=68225 RepID=A0ABU6CIN6_9ACTN|nr:hypothetical protein [Streptomyces kunmingensis]MEB3964552.1 hypothetical protein [Streptomyces kunmingensis]